MIDRQTPNMFIAARNEREGTSIPNPPPPPPPRATGVAGKAIHQNSHKAWALFPAAARAQEIKRVLRALDRPATDREVCIYAKKTDMNWARPTITRLIEEGWLVETGTRKCPVTNRTVRVVDFHPDMEPTDADHGKG